MATKSKRTYLISDGPDAWEVLLAFMYVYSKSRKFKVRFSFHPENGGASTTQEMRILDVSYGNPEPSEGIFILKLELTRDEVVEAQYDAHNRTGFFMRSALI